MIVELTDRLLRDLDRLERADAAYMANPTDETYGALQRERITVANGIAGIVRRARKQVQP